MSGVVLVGGEWRGCSLLYDGAGSVEKLQTSGLRTLHATEPFATREMYSSKQALSM